ncbi:MAG: type I-E CRISPR-associated protein Cse1/CasA [Acidobacteriota bacterium]
MLERLVADDGPSDLELLGLQAHQTHAVHAFLVQLAALALRRGGSSRRLALSADEWRSLLFELGDADEEAWQLVVDDWSKPAFLQPPSPGGDRTAYKRVEPTPQGIDVLVLAKNHDIKSARDLAARPEHWVYTLISLQTMEGFSGRGNYGIARMNSGFGNRPSVGYAPDAGWPARFRRDLDMILDPAEQPEWSSFGFGDPQASDSIELLWLEPWDGATSIEMARLHPWMLEVCRRMRLAHRQAGGLEAHLAATKAARVDAKALLGHLGDPWMPVRRDRAELSALTVGNTGFTYRLLVDILFGAKYAPSRALEIRDDEAEAPLLVAQVLVRGQGQTNGYYSRRIPVTPDVVQALSDPSGLAFLGELAEERVELVVEAQRKVLRPAVCALLQGGGDDLKLNDPLAHPFVDRLDAEVDSIFFDRLWRDAGLDPAKQEHAWHYEVWSLCRSIFEDAVRSAPSPTTRRWRAIAAGTRRLEGGAHRLFCEGFRNDQPPEPTVDSLEDDAA